MMIVSQQFLAWEDIADTTALLEVRREEGAEKT
jgi:hypothetical protein